MRVFFKSVGDSPTSLLMVDYDGTLAPFHVAREDAFPYPGIANLLREIMDTGITRVVVISGRDVHDVVRLIGLSPVPEIWGLHGLQRRRPNGVIETARLDEPTAAALANARNWLSYHGLDEMCEMKATSVAVHWRGQDQKTAEEIRGKALVGWSVIARRESVKLLEFDGGIEICAQESDKGKAVRATLSEMPAGIPAAYLGDDNTDENAFRAIAGVGLSILVRPRARKTLAEYWMKPPEELRQFLESWLEACRNNNASGQSAAAVSG